MRAKSAANRFAPDQSDLLPANFWLEGMPVHAPPANQAPTITITPPSGVPAGGETRINTTTANVYSQPEVAA